MKKAQIQMGETIFVIIIILFLVALGLVFLFRSEQIETEETATEFAELDAVALAQLVANLPELIHAPSSVQQQSSFDTSKLDAFQTLLNNEPDISMEYYFEKLGNVKIELIQIYPEPLDDEGHWELYVNNFNVGDKITSYGIPMKIPTSLYDPVDNTYSFGMLYVTKYVKVD